LSTGVVVTVGFWDRRWPIVVTVFDDVVTVMNVGTILDVIVDLALQ
jgi:hypothetical protein